MRRLLIVSLLLSLPALAQEASADPAPADPAPPPPSEDQPTDSAAPEAEPPPAAGADDAQSESPPAPGGDATEPAAPQPAAGADAAAEGDAEALPDASEAVGDAEEQPAESESESGSEPASQAEGDASSEDQPAEAETTPESEPGALPAEGAPAATDADPSKRLLLLGVSDKGVGEELTASLNEQFNQQAAKSFIGEVVSRAQLKEMLDEAARVAVEGCDAEACMADLGQKVDAGRVTAATATMAGADVLLTVLVIDPATGKLLTSHQVKTPNEADLVTYAMRNLTALALTGRAADQTVPVRISVDADEPGTRLTIDGRDEGEAPKTVMLAPGDHKVVASLPGYEPTTQVITVKEATPLAVEVSLYWERFPLWPIAATLGVASFFTLASGAAIFMIGWYNYDGFAVLGAPLGDGHSYRGHTPATSSTLAATNQNALIWIWTGSVITTIAVLIATAALAFEIGDLSLLAVQVNQYDE